MRFSVIKPANDNSVFLVKIVVFRQLTTAQCTAEMFWVPRSTNSRHTLLQKCSKINEFFFPTKRNHTG